MMMDIDFFKQFNDTYGHQEGDKALKSVAHVLAVKTNRSYDYAFRVGGEEFVILAYHDDFEKMNTFAMNLIQQIEALKISHSTSSASNYVTISAGIIQFGHEHLLNTDDMYKAVDDLLYQAKQNGRNQIKALYID